MFDEIFDELNSRIKITVARLRDDLSKMPINHRVHPSILDSLRVDDYGTPTPINQMANISVPEPRLIVIKPWQQSQLRAIEKAIRDSGLGSPVIIDGQIRIPFSAFTEERITELLKLVKKTGEDSRIAIRKCLRDAKEMIGQVDGGDADQACKKVDELGAEGHKQIDALVASKEKEVLPPAV